jgi:hypothetical protein
VAPAIFRRLVEEFALNPQAASKYRMSASSLQALAAAPVVSAAGDAEVLHA